LLVQGYSRDRIMKVTMDTTTIEIESNDRLSAKLLVQGYSRNRIMKLTMDTTTIEMESNDRL
jgi:alanine racemase